MAWTVLTEHSVTQMRCKDVAWTVLSQHRVTQTVCQGMAWTELSQHTVIQRRGKIEIRFLREIRRHS